MSCVHRARALSSSLLGGEINLKKRGTRTGPPGQPKTTPRREPKTQEAEGKAPTAGTPSTGIHRPKGHHRPAESGNARINAIATLHGRQTGGTISKMKPTCLRFRASYVRVASRRFLVVFTAAPPYCPVKSICLFSSLYLLVESGRLAECSAPRLTCAAVVRASGN